MNDAPRVLVYASFALPPQLRFIEQPMRHLQRWRPTLLCAARSPKSIDLGGLDVVSLDPPWPRKLWWARRRLRGLMRRAAPADVRQVKALGASLLHAHFGPEGVLMAPVAKAAGLPLLVTMHGFDIQSKESFWTSGGAGWWHRDYPNQLRAIAADGAHFVAVSRAIARLAVQWGIPESQVHYQPIGIDTRLFKPTPVPLVDRPPRVVFVGNHIERKGGHHLVRAMAMVRREVPNAELMMVGDGPERPRWQALAEQLGVRATFTGRVSPDGVREALGGAVAFCLPAVRLPHHNLAEGFGLVVIEAAAMGLPVVTSAQGRDSEGLIHGETGFAVPGGDEAALAEHLTTLLQDRALAQRMADAGPGFVRDRFDLHQCTLELELLYDRLASGAA